VIIVVFAPNLPAVSTSLLTFSS